MKLKLLFLLIIFSVGLPMFLGLLFRTNLVSRVIQAQSEAERLKNHPLSGIILKGGGNKCNANTSYNYCYKLFDENGDSYWVRPSAGVKAQYVLPSDPTKVLDPMVGVRVNATANQVLDPKDANPDRTYFNMKALTIPNDFNYPVNFGLGGTSSIDSPYITDLNAKSMQIGIFWSAIKPKPNTTKAEMQANLARYLDGNLQLCQKKGISCGIFIGGVPDYAVKKGLAKHPITCNGDYPFPVDADHYPALAEFVALVVERYDGDGADDAPGKPIANKVTLFNEVDFNQSNRAKGSKPACGSPLYWTDEDLNGNGVVDSTDYFKLMQAVHKSVHAASSKVLLGTSRFAAADTKSLAFIVKVFQASANQPFYDLMAVNYYDNFRDFPNWTKEDSYAGGGVRGKISWLEKLMSQYGGSKPIVFTEIGYCAKPGTPDFVSQPTRVAKTLVEAFSKVSVQEANYFTLFADPARSFLWECGLVEQGPTGDVKRPTYQVFKTLQQYLGGTKFLNLERSNPKTIEGYVFLDPVTQKRREVVWKKPGSTSKPVVLYKRNSVKIINLDGTTSTITDQSANDSEKAKPGYVGVSLTETPIIVEF